MGVKRIPVGGGQPLDFFKSRDWSTPFLPLFYAEPTATVRGVRTASCTGVANYKGWGRALYLSPSSGGVANRVYELAEASLISVTGIFDKYFYFAMTLNQTSGPIVNAAGDCFQGFGIGSMGSNTPWVGQLAANGSAVIHVQWNLTRGKWELFAANETDPGVTVDLDTQPNFTIDQRLPEIAMEWFPETQTINIYCNQVLIHSQYMVKMLPTSGVYAGSNAWELVMFLTLGSNSAFFHTEAGFYLPRFYQPVDYQPVL